MNAPKSVSDASRPTGTHLALREDTNAQLLFQFRQTVFQTKGDSICHVSLFPPFVFLLCFSPALCMCSIRLSFRFGVIKEKKKRKMSLMEEIAQFSSNSNSNSDNDDMERRFASLHITDPTATSAQHTNTDHAQYCNDQSQQTNPLHNQMMLLQQRQQQQQRQAQEQQQKQQHDFAEMNRAMERCSLESCEERLAFMPYCN